MEKYTCPCCGYKTLDDEHEYDIYPICFWEDDLFQFENVDLLGANPVSLREAQQNFIKFGACEINMIKNVRKPNIDDIKDGNWQQI